MSNYQTKQHTMEGILALLVPFGAFLMTFGIVYINRSATNKEKLSMLDKGFTPKEIAEAMEEKSNGSKNLSNGLLFIGAASGVLFGFFLAQSFPIDPILAYVSCAFLFGGLGLVAAYFINSKKSK